MGLTILEAAKLGQGTEIQRAVVELYARNAKILEYLPFVNIPGNAIKYNREEILPGIGFRGVNEGYTASTGVLNPQVESLSIAGGDLEVDNFIVQTEGEDTRASQESMKAKALSQAWQETFFKGDSDTDPREFDGLQKRLVGDQLIPAGATSGGDALSLAVLDEAIDAVMEPQFLAMNKTMARRFSAAARDTGVGGYITWTEDSFGRRIRAYNDLPILAIENLKGGDDVLPFDEANPGGGAAASTSIYVLSFADEMVNGIQNGEMDVRDLGEMETKPSLLTRIEWYAGIQIKHGRAAARLHGIKNAAITK